MHRQPDPGPAGRARAAALIARMRALCMIAAATAATPALATGLDVALTGLRNTRGVLRICLSRNPSYFPDCSGDPQARKLSLPAAARAVHFDDLPEGTYAFTAVHDENNDGVLNTMLGIPREGFAFSNNPPIRFGAPSYASVRFTIGAQRGNISVRFRYLL